MEAVRVSLIRNGEDCREVAGGYKGCFRLPITSYYMLISYGDATNVLASVNIHFIFITPHLENYQRHTQYF